MKKLLYGLLSLIFLFTLTGCQEKFDPQTALTESRTALTEFMKLYEDEEQVLNEFNEEELMLFFTEKHKDYFSQNFIDNVLPDKLDNLTFGEDGDFIKMNKNFPFLNVKIGETEEKNLTWAKMEIKEDEVAEDKESVTFYVSRTGVGGYIEMVKENGQWKINNILNL